jgi:hypothetical protein
LVPIPESGNEETVDQVLLVTKLFRISVDFLHTLPHPYLSLDGFNPTFKDDDSSRIIEYGLFIGVRSRKLMVIGYFMAWDQFQLDLRLMGTETIVI